MDRLFVLLASGLMFLAVAAGAFGAHGLEGYFSRFPEVEGTFDTAVRYHLVHALALLAVAWAANNWGDVLIHWAGFLFVTGVVLFSGSLYLLVLTRVRWLGAITPLGGLAFLAGWLTLFVAVWRGS